MIIIGPIIIIVMNQPSPAQPAVSDDGPFDAQCPHCRWSGTYPTKARAKQALGRHNGHCTHSPEAIREREERAAQQQPTSETQRPPSKLKRPVTPLPHVDDQTLSEFMNQIFNQ
jgi:hypothetical protein